MPDISQTIIQWLLIYSGFALFLLLAVGIFGLPIPGETILIAAGWLIAKGKVGVFPILAGGICGSICGITFSYFLGKKTGLFLIRKYGHWFKLRSENILRANYWFERVGKWALFFGYFIPLVRHLTGYVAGTTRLSYYKFAIFAYSGALIWTISFLLIGYFFGEIIHGSKIIRS